ncbi:hypothetical protein C5S31_04535 [ANME-1 cluster archaeon GoMg2]|nr:hypothetical protein [ANME-1 cluster archaeon GoMg2]
MNKKFCPNCGAELSKDDIFCGSCGAKIDEFGAVKSEKPTGTKRRPTGVTIIAILNILGGIGGLIAGFGMMALSGDLFQYYLSDEVAALFGILGMLFIIIGFVDLVIGYGLWTLKRWARMAAIIMAIIGIVCSTGETILMMSVEMGDNIGSMILSVLISVIIIWYLSKPEIEEVFEG